MNRAKAVQSGHTRSLAAQIQLAHEMVAGIRAIRPDLLETDILGHAQRESAKGPDIFNILQGYKQIAAKGEKLPFEKETKP